MERIVTEKRSFVDEYGRERIFYGVNIVDKRKNSEDNKFGFNIDDKLLDEMTSRGLNLIRLGTTWSMIEPEPGSRLVDILVLNLLLLIVNLHI